MGYASHPLLALSAMIWMLVPSAAAQDFDQSLDALVRQRVITPKERELLSGGGSAVRMDRSRFEEACIVVTCPGRTAPPGWPGVRRGQRLRIGFA